eukprot:3569898-Rhodomonas_salina.3
MSGTEIAYGATAHTGLAASSCSAGTTIRYLSTAHRIPPYASSVPHITYHHTTLAQYTVYRTCGAPYAISVPPIA